MPNYAKLCKSMQNYTNLWAMPGYAEPCQIMACAEL